MIRTKFSEEQPAVKYTQTDDKYYIFICLNGEWKEEEISKEDGIEKYWECDYNEIITDEINIDDVIANPKNYIDYVIKKVDPAEQLRADVDYLLLLAE